MINSDVLMLCSHSVDLVKNNGDDPSPSPHSLLYRVVEMIGIGTLIFV